MKKTKIPRKKVRGKKATATDGSGKKATVTIKIK